MKVVRSFTWPALALAIALVHSACGDDSSTNGATPNPTDAGTDAGGSAGSAGAGATGGTMPSGGAGGASGTAGGSGSDAGPVCTPRDQIPRPPPPSVEAPNTCPAITACGGPIENQKWVYSKLCIDEDVAFEPMFSECPRAEYRGIGDVKLSGSLELSGGTATHSLSLEVTGVFHAPAECHACGCKDFQAVLIRNGAGPNTFCYEDCNPDSSCRCLVDYDLTVNEQPSYTISGSALSAGARTYDFCASAGKVTLAEKGSAPALAGSAELVPENSLGFPEICDGLDNDQNGQVDDAITECPTECNTKGVCANVTRRCLGEAGWSCEYASPDREQGEEVTCDGLDNDCDGMVDEGLTGCVEICDGLDNDNNGSVDDNPQDPHCPAGLGVCSTGVVATCLGAAGWQCSYTSGVHEATESRCDGLDNDCDGLKDEGCSCATGKSKLFVVRWGRTPALVRADLDGQNVETVAALSGFAILGITIDSERNKIYFYDGTTLKRASLDGTAIEPLWTGSTQMWEVDSTAGRAYTECGTSNICGVSFATPTQGTTLVQPAAVAGMDIDLVNRHVYWSDHGAGYEKNLLRANLDGTQVTGIMKLPFSPLMLTVDPGQKKLYWATGTGISEAGFDGRNDREIIALPGSYTYDLAVDNRGNKLYFTDFRANEVRRANLDGSGFQTLIPNVDQPQNIALYLCTP